jgi:hypothetical protein
MVQFIQYIDQLKKSQINTQDKTKLYKKQKQLNAKILGSKMESDSQDTSYKREKRISVMDNISKTELNTTPKLNRRKRFISLFRNNDDKEQNFLFKMLEFLMKNRRSVIPVVTVMREINTLVKSANGELNHSSKERNNFIGTPPQITPITYDLELGNDSRAIAILKRLLGLGVRGGKLTINGSG